MKFRISVSKENLEWIVSQPECPEDLFKVISLALFKIGSGLLKPAFEIKQSSEQQTAEQQEQAYRYVNDLMTEEEAAAYEAANDI